MNRILVFMASLIVALVAISSTATASPAEWKQAVIGTKSPAEFASSNDGASPNFSQWATAPNTRFIAFVAIQL